MAMLTVLYFAMFEFLRQQTDQRIDENLVNILVADPGFVPFGIADPFYIKNELDKLQLTHLPSDPSVYLLVDRNNQYVAGNLQSWPKGISTVDRNRFEFEAEVFDGETTTLHTVRALATVLANTGGFKLLVGRDIYEISALKDGLLQLFVGCVVATVLAAMMGAYWVSRIVSRRLKKVNEVTRNVMDGDLSQRIVTDASGDQFDDLSGNINSMLERIQYLVEEIRNVSNNIAHDLKTPLTRLYNQLDELARDLDGVEIEGAQDLRQKTESAIAEADSLLGTFDALLRIANLENKSFGDAFSDVSVYELLNELGDLYGPIADEKNVALKITVDEDAGTIFVDRNAVAQAISNLLDNALKYSPQGGTVVVSGSQVSQGFEIDVTDTGQGIPAEHHATVLKRFVRLDDSSRTTSGNGLGLSLVAAVARMHKLELVLENAQPGLKVRLKNLKHTPKTTSQ